VATIISAGPGEHRHQCEGDPDGQHGDAQVVRQAGSHPADDRTVATPHQSRDSVRSQFDVVLEGAPARAPRAGFGDRLCSICRNGVTRRTCHICRIPRACRVPRT